MAEHIDRIDPRDHARESNSQTLSPSRSYNSRARPFDEVIVSLANAKENRRARQVSEWEQMRRQVFPRLQI